MYLFQSNTTIFYYLTDWGQVLVIRPSSAHPYTEFKKSLHAVHTKFSVIWDPIKLTPVFKFC